MCRLSWFLDPGGWNKAVVGLYFIFPGICTLSLNSPFQLFLQQTGCFPKYSSSFFQCDPFKSLQPGLLLLELSEEAPLLHCGGLLEERVALLLSLSPPSLSQGRPRHGCEVVTVPYCPQIAKQMLLMPNNWPRGLTAGSWSMLLRGYRMQ
ncbi:hypothetical protein STEG23_011418 [Scotinomys teguina]